jgi:methanogenic corrinoid protein MtbC1
MADLKKLYDAVLNGDSKTSVAITKEAIAEKIDPMVLITNHMVVGPENDTQVVIESGLSAGDVLERNPTSMQNGPD